MGIDARILLKITNPISWLSPSEIRKLSAKLTSTLGVEHFFLDPKEDQHAIEDVAVINEKWPDEYEQEAGGPFSRSKPRMFNSHDADPVFSKPNEQFLQVHVYSRFYGEDYPRGDWKTLCFIMLWCQYNIKDCEVWYGGDSGGSEIELFDVDRMQKMTRMFLTSGHDMYWMNSKLNQLCDFCQQGVVATGGGGGREFYSCRSCGGEWLKEGDKITHWGDEPGDSNDITLVSFYMSQQITEGKRPMYQFDGIFRAKYPYIKDRGLKAPALALESAKK